MRLVVTLIPLCASTGGAIIALILKPQEAYTVERTLSNYTSN